MIIDGKGGKGTPKMPEKPNVDVSNLPDIRCENPECGNVTFQEVVLLKRVPAFMTDNGKEGIVPIPAFACNACGFVNDMFIPAFMKTGAKKPEGPENRKIVEGEQPKPKIEIVQ